MSYHSILFYFTQHGRDFLAGRWQRDGMSRIFRASFPAGVFLNRMRIPKGNRAWMPDLARFGMDADRGRPQPVITCPILFRKTRRKKCTENRDMPSRCRRPAKKSLPCVRHPLPHFSGVFPIRYKVIAPVFRYMKYRGGYLGRISGFWNLKSFNHGWCL